MLHAHLVLDRDGVQVTDVACRHEARRGDVHEAGHHAVVLVRRGCFTRSAGGTRQVLDPTSVYGINPGDEQSYDHPHTPGDDCTSVRVDAGLLATLWGGEPTLPDVLPPLAGSPNVDLEHRLLLAAARRVEGRDDLDLVERTISLVASVLATADARRVASGRPSTARARTALVDAARQCLAADPGRSLPDLAASLGASPHHLSRTFRAATGHTIARHRMRLRTRVALERLAEGDHDLTRLAADLGFADHSHLCRVLRTETGHTPSALRHALTAPQPSGSTIWRGDDGGAGGDRTHDRWIMSPLL